MGRPRTSERPTEKFVQWREPVHLKGGMSNFDGPGSTSTVRNTRVTTRQKSLLTSLQATIRDPPAVQEEVQDTIPTAVQNETCGPSLSPTPAQLQASDPAPRFRPPRHIQNAVASTPNPTSRVFVGASEFSSDVAGDANNRRTGRRTGIHVDSGVAEHEDEETTGPQQRQPEPGEAIHPNEMNG